MLTNTEKQEWKTHLAERLADEERTFSAQELVSLTEWIESQPDRADAMEWAFKSNPEIAGRVLKAFWREYKSAEIELNEFEKWLAVRREVERRHRLGVSGIEFLR